MNLLKVFLVFFFLLQPLAKAELIQLLHTNDLHSHLEHAPHLPHVGGYERLKFKLNQLKRHAKDQGIDTIAMDAGDFLEGNIFYLADKGRKSTQAYNKIGYDVAVLGNHDYLMGLGDLDALLKNEPPTMAMLAANLNSFSQFPNIKKHIRPVWETVLNGVKVGVIGITTNEVFYKWRLAGNGFIEDEVIAARKWAKYLKNRGNDIIIALTHIGIARDKKLAFNVPELDLIVGGHDHTVFKEVLYHTSSNGKKIPIVQAGEMAKWIGRLMIDFNKEKKEFKIHNYEVIPVNGEADDPEIKEIILKAQEELNLIYGYEWLEEIVGESSLRPMEDKNDEVIWNHFINDSMREAVKADFAIHASALSGNNYPIGLVTRRHLYNGNPRHFEFSDKFGYRIYTAEISGLLIKKAAQICLRLGLPLYFSGITFKWKKLTNGTYAIWNIQHEGKKIHSLKRYKVAFSEAVIRGGLGITRLIRSVIHRPQRSEISMWSALEEKFIREKTLGPDYVDYYSQERSAFFP
jgi:5'-nucleotidase/UDP-sugar diphosphatase